jgi:hypothetical protein
MNYKVSNFLSTKFNIVYTKMITNKLIITINCLNQNITTNWMISKQEF